jgi:hypothetical protein
MDTGGYEVPIVSIKNCQLRKSKEDVYGLCVDISTPYVTYAYSF